MRRGFSPNAGRPNLYTRPCEGGIIAPMDKVRILLADDHAIVRAGIRNALIELPNLEFMEDVEDGPSLETAITLNPPDFLLIDVTMPNFDPIVTIRRIRINFPNMKILVVSAYDDDVYVQGLLGAGVNGYHMKDQPLSDLRLAVQRVINGEKWISSRLLDKLVSHSDTPASAQSSLLTTRQRDILRLLQEGLDNQSIARRMSLSVKTIENHLTRLYRQIEVQSRLEAVNYINQHPEILARSGHEVFHEMPPVKASQPGQFTVLLVDDNSRYRRQLQRMVGKGYPKALIYEAGNVQEAAHLAKSIAPNLALVDIVLGDENGIHCTRRIKALSPATRVVLISAYPDREFHRQGLEAGAIALLDKKDLDAGALQQVIDDVIA